jgi:hypothetical protein
MMSLENEQLILTMLLHTDMSFPLPDWFDKSHFLKAFPVFADENRRIREHEDGSGLVSVIDVIRCFGGEDDITSTSVSRLIQKRTPTELTDYLIKIKINGKNHPTPVAKMYVCMDFVMHFLKEGLIEDPLKDQGRQLVHHLNEYVSRNIRGEIDAFIANPEQKYNEVQEHQANKNHPNFNFPLAEFQPMKDLEGVDIQAAFLDAPTFMESLIENSKNMTDAEKARCDSFLCIKI